MRVRAGIFLWIVESCLALIVAAPPALTMAALTGHLPAKVGLAGPFGSLVVLEAAWLNPGPMIGAGVASLVLAGIAALVAGPLLLAGAVACVEDPGSCRVPLEVVTAGARRALRYVVLQVVFFASCAASVAGPVWLWGPLTGAPVGLALVAAACVLRDATAVVLRRTRDPVTVARGILSMVSTNPVGTAAGAVLSTALVGVLVSVTVRLQTAGHGTSLVASLAVLAASQSAMLARCVVRTWWLGLLVDTDRESAGS